EERGDGRKARCAFSLPVFANAFRMSWGNADASFSGSCLEPMRLASPFHGLRRRLRLRRLRQRRRLGLPCRLEVVGIGRGVDVVDQLGDACSVAAEIALEIARGGSD